MLTETDVEFMRQTRRELIANRTSKIIVKYLDDSDRDPFTGEPIGDTTHEREVDAVVTEISTGEDRKLIGGIEVQTGDLRLSIALDLIADIVDKATTLVYDGKHYEILAADKKGIGERNRFEILARLQK